MTTIEVMRKALEAMRGAAAELSSILAAINDERMPHDGDEFHERLDACLSVSAALRAEIERLEAVEPVASHLLDTSNDIAVARAAPTTPAAIPALTDEEAESLFSENWCGVGSVQVAYALAAERAGVQIK